MYDGFINLHKPAGISSAKALNAIKKLFKDKKVGHAGTLDPFASGVLPVAVGEATKAIDYIMAGKKEYIFEILWGIDTDTNDITGALLKQSDKIPNKGEIEVIMPQFYGVIQQIPPNVSAISDSGQRAYKLQRLGQNFELQPREVEIYELEMLEHNNNRTKFRIESGKGFYIRALVRDMAKLLGVYGTVNTLLRSKCGAFEIYDAVELKKIENLLQSTQESCKSMLLMPILSVLDDILVQQVSADEANLLVHGAKVRADHVNFSSTIRCIAARGEQPVAICIIQDGFLVPQRVFNIIDK